MDERCVIFKAVIRGRYSFDWSNFTMPKGNDAYETFALLQAPRVECLSSNLLRVLNT